MLSVPFIVKNADGIWHKIRWQASDGLPTCVCGCAHTYKLGDGRYKCKECGKVFSDTTGTLLHHSRLSKEIWLIAIFKFANITECSAIDLQKECGVNYKTAYLMLQKLRYVAGKGEISLDGIVKMDEAYIGAEWKNVHFNKKMAYMRENGFMPKTEKHYTRRQLLCAVSSKKYHILSLTDEHNQTMLLHVPNPITKDIIKGIVCNPKHSITGLVTDESHLYTGIFKPVHQVNHSQHRYEVDGYTSNVAENRFSWVKRKWNGVYSHTSEKYLQLYLWQRQWHFNNDGKSTDDRFYALLGICATNSVTYREVFEYDYQAVYPVSRRRKEEEYHKRLKDDCSFLFQVEDRYGRKY